MPICNKLPMEGDNKVTASTEIDDHASEAAKVRRQREQAYFNSYNFDAIEVLPYEEEKIDSPAVRGNGVNLTERRRNSPAKLSKGKYKSQSSLGIHQPLSPISRRRLKNSLLMVKRGAGSRSSTSSSRSSGSNYSLSQHAGVKYAYLQRLGKFFGGDSNSGQFRRSTSMTNSVQSSESGSSEPMPYEVILGIRNGTSENGRRTQDDGGFLLPRAMLKYQSVGSINSMPLATISTAHNNKIRQNSSIIGSNSSTNNNKNSNNHYTNFSNISTYNNPIESGSNSNGNGSGSGFSLQMVNSSGNKNASTLRSSEKTRPTNAYGHAVDNTGFLIIAETSSIQNGNSSAVGSYSTTAITTTTTTNNPITTLARNKKKSTSSIITTTTISSIESEPTIEIDADKKLTTNPMKLKSPTTTLTTPSSSVALTKSSKSTTAAALVAKKSTSDSAHEQQRDRASSHQSHYSTTDKSGSSGYYSSNVCSTYSLEDHIYCEPVVDILDLNSKSVANNGKVEKPLPLPLTHTHAHVHSQQKVSSLSKKIEQHDTKDISSQARDLKAIGGDGDAAGQNQRYKDCDGKNDERNKEDVKDNDIDGNDDEQLDDVILRRAENMDVTLRRQKQNQLQSQHFSENLRILETSIENLDRHLRNFPSLSSQEQIVSFVQTNHSFSLSQHPNNDMMEKPRMQSHLPTIMEGYDPATQPRPFQDDIADDSLLDIDLDSFLLVNERNGSKRNKTRRMIVNRNVNGIDNPTFLTDEQEENHYKCAKYINSCPDDAYRVESDVGGGTRTGSDTVSVSEKSLSVENFVKRYEDQLHFQNTRELLEDVREKIRLLAHSRYESRSNSDGSRDGSNTPSDNEMPKELEGMIKTLKMELESYLNRMNQQSELEIRQLCSGLVKNHNIVKMRKAFERRRSISSLNALDECEYEASPYEIIHQGTIMPPGGVPVSIRQKINSIRCVSDPNFKMKRKSLNEVFPIAGCYIESIGGDPSLSKPIGDNNNSNHLQRINSTQMQRNLAFHKPILNQADAKIDANGCSTSGELSRASSGTESGETGDKDAMLEWHRKKPSIWEMYYGTNRMNQTLLGKRNDGILMSSSGGSNQATMSYPSSRPESDFTLDLPRAEQLRIKMEKDKKFRQRCRYITTFLSLLFFLLTVMVTSLVLTRGKRMFGSMI